MATVLDTVAFHYIGNIYKTQSHHLNVLHWLRTNQKNLFLMSTIHNNKKILVVHRGWSPAPYVFTATHTVPIFYHTLYKRKIPATPASLHRKQIPHLYFHGRRIVAMFYHALHKSE
jgi:hypothetical protein